MVNRRGRPRRRASRVRTSPRSLVRREARLQSGVAFKPSPNPPLWTGSPWFPLTVVNAYKANATIHTEHLGDMIRKALGWNDFVKSSGGKTTKLPITFRVLTARIWGLAGQPVQLTPYEILGGNHITREIDDIGGRITYSTAGWRWGASSRIDMLQECDGGTAECTKTIPIVALQGASESAQVLLYIQVLFRAADAPSPSLQMARLTAKPLSLSEMEL